MKNQQHRMATWWIHWQDLQWPDPDNMDKIKRRAEGYAKANVSAAMLFGTHFRWDYLPVFPLLHDYIATVAEQLHQYGVKLFDHHSCNLVHRYSTREEMRRVMQDSMPHLPFSPTFEAAADWKFNGDYLNDWRMIDVKTGQPLWFPQYTAQGFCPRNPQFRKAYQEYAKYLIAETGIDGLSADDALYYMHHNACGCEHCRKELQNRAGIDLPPVEDSSFWGNWDNPAWHHWLDLRFESGGEFYEELRKVLPQDFMLTGCGAASASATAPMTATDARQFTRGWNYVNMELSGNTPPYKHDKKTTNVPIPARVVNSSHHQAVARERGIRAFCTGFAHTKTNANHVWATAKLLDADAWIGTLKTRLGLPFSVLNTLPWEEDIVGEAFGFEAAHPELFQGELVGQLGVYFSYETRNHTLYGSIGDGYYKDYSDALRLLFTNGICPHTVFAFPENPDTYPVILLSGVAQMTEAEKAAMEQYVSAGGKVIAVGPAAAEGCVHNWKLQNRLDVPASDFFTTVPDGVHVKTPDWIRKTQVPESDDAPLWQNPAEGVFYHPHRLGQTNQGKVLELVRLYMNPMPVELTQAKGYLSSMRQDDTGLVVQLLAEDYDVDIDHKLDQIRTHRSRVNILTDITPIGVDGKICFKTQKTPTVYTPFNRQTSTVTHAGDELTIQLPENCSYALIRFA